MPARQTWPGVVVHPRGLGGGVVEVGVGEHDQRALAAELARERDEVARRRRRRSRGAVSGEPVNEIRRDVAGAGTSAAPARSPIPWTTLKTPGGSPASAVRSASSEQESGDHSAGLRTTVQPAASAGAVFQVESMNGAFQGVITTAGAGRHRGARG